MEQNTIKALVLDLGRVVIPVDFEATVKAFSNLLGKDFSSFYKYKKQSPVFDLLETGKIEPADFWKELRVLTGIEASDEALTEAWNAMLFAAPRQRIERLTAYKKHVPVYILSNTNAVHEKCINQLLQKELNVPGLDHLFTKAYLSHVIGYRKPDAEAYRYVLNDIGQQAEDVLFVDDLEENTAAAKALGMQVLTLQKMDDLLPYLEERLGSV